MKLQYSYLFIFFYLQVTVADSQNFEGIGMSIGVKNALKNQHYSEKYSEVIAILNKYFLCSRIDREQYENSPLNISFLPNPLYIIDYSQISFVENDAVYYKPSVLNIYQEDSLSVAVVAFSNNQGITNSISSILLVYVDKRNKKIINTTALNLKKQSWKFIEKQHVKVYVSQNLSFEESQIKNLEEFSIKLASKLNLLPIKVNYILGSSKQEIQTLRGILFQLIQSEALAEIPTNTIYITNRDFNCIHEFVHIYLHKLWPTINPLFDEGMAVYWGNYLQKSIDEILPAYRKFLKNRNDINLSDFDSLGPIVISQEYGNLYYIK